MTADARHHADTEPTEGHGARREISAPPPGGPRLYAPSPLVVKIGGGANVRHERFIAEARELAPLVVVHGFSDEATRLGTSLGVPPVFVDSPGGHRSRFTDDATLDVVHLAAQRVNARLVGALKVAGADAVGLRAGDVGVAARWKDTLKAVTPEGKTVLRRGDRSGRITAVDPSPLRAMVAAGLVPVLAPIGRTPDGALASLDGDRCAAAVAGALGARALVILTGVRGVLRDVVRPETLLPRLALTETDESAGFIQGPMKRKVLAAKEALAAGVPRVLIAGADAASPVQAALKGDATEVVA